MHHKPVIAIVLAACATAWSAGGPADLLSDTWVATDALGRALPSPAECPEPRQDRFVGIFYFLWLGPHGTSGPYDITRLLAANPTDPQWGPVHLFHHWGESEAGYYLSHDPWVIRRHCHMLVDAGIDTVILDVTNGFRYTPNYMTLCNVYSQIRAEGGRTPQMCFLANSGSASVVQALYDEFYAKNLYPELWFRWMGKPLMLAPSEGLSDTLVDFFTLRQSWAWSASPWFGDGRDKWPWLDHHPQAYGWHEPGVAEEVSVCVAQHPTSNIGRSFHDGAQPAPAQCRTDEGLCFAEQAERALQIDPKFIFVTGWNEWVAQRFLSDGSNPFLGRTLPAGESYFVDGYNQEYSRDIEPMKGGHTDNYYYQLVGLVRRFKGVRRLEAPSPPTTIAIDGLFDDWTNVTPDYWDTVNDTTHRNHAGWGSAGTCVNNTGRNDLLHMKVAYDAANVYFLAETREALTPRTGSHWMMLYIDADQDHDTGWEGYEYLVEGAASDTAVTLKRNVGGYNWVADAQIPYRVGGNRMELAIPRGKLCRPDSTDVFFDFKWSDNVQEPSDIISHCTTGDSAPNRRANYRFSTLVGPPEPVSGLESTHSPHSIVLKWTNSESPDADRVIVRFSTTKMPTTPTEGTGLLDVAVSPGTPQEHTHEPLTPGATYHYAIFARDADGEYAEPATISVRPLACDFDGDDDVDQSDYGMLQGCMAGSFVRIPDGCEEVDLDGDHDVDGHDLQLFVTCMTGPNQPPRC